MYRFWQIQFPPFYLACLALFVLWSGLHTVSNIVLFVLLVLAVAHGLYFWYWSDHRRQGGR